MTSIQDITKIFRSTIMSEMSLAGQYVRDSASEYGSYLDKNTTGSIFNSIAKTDTMILFELKSRSSGNDLSDDNGTNIYAVRSYTLHLWIYGDGSDDFALKLISRFRTERVRNYFLEKEIYIEKIDSPERIVEFINNSVWVRNDVDIYISCQFTITPQQTETEYRAINTLMIDQVR